MLGATVVDFNSANFSFSDGSLALFEGDGSPLSGGTGSDYLDLRQHAELAASAGDGDDVIYVGNALSSGDMIVGGNGVDELIVDGVYGEQLNLASSTIVGIEKIVVERDSSVSLLLANESVTSALGGLLTVDGSALSEQDSLEIDGSNVTGGSLSLIGGSGQDILTGGDNADALSGGDGADILNGGDGNDLLTGGLGGDILTGGAGDDRFVIGFGFPRGESSAAEESLFDHITDFQGAGSAGGDLIDLPSFWGGLPLVFAGKWDFEWSNTGDSGVQMNPDWVGDGMIDVIWRQLGSDVQVWLDANDDGQFSEGDMFVVLENISALSREDFVDNFVAWRGTVGDDSPQFDGRDDIAYGLDGNDTLSGGDGNDSLYGGTGNDTLDGEAGDDMIVGGDGMVEVELIIYGLDGNDTLSGGDGNDSLYGGTGNDTLDGEAGDDMIVGGDGNDVLNGGDGQDFIVGERGNDTLNGGNDADELYASYWDTDDVDSINTLNGEAGDDRLHGSEGKDTLNGGADNDTLYGGNNDDTLNGNDGADQLYGDSGNDVLNGGAGRPNVWW
ncbi:hypothetical protein ASG25_04710 [Rhizobium sp. Leaf384]|nr:hypothetical protein ASG25_04710 [Rhizobium sp. Leaf384]